MMNNITKMQSMYSQQINAISKKYEYQIVVNDETEFFSYPGDPQFKYPYQ